MGKRNSLTVVIATYNRAKSLKNCLVSLTKQTDKDFAVLIIDGGSTDNTSKLIEQFKKSLKLRLLVDKTPHLAYIRDLGWRHAQGEIIASIDDDAIAEPSWVSSIKHLLRNREVGGVTGPTVIPKDLLASRDIFLFYTTTNPLLKLVGSIYFRFFMQEERFAIGKIYPSGAWSPGSNFPTALKLKKPLEVDYLEACNFAVPKEILRKVGGYDLEYKDTSEWCEIDLAFRIRKRGYCLIFDPKVAVEHNVSCGGVFLRRINTLARLKNFIRFYLHTYYPKTLFGYIQFTLFVLFQMFYYLYLLFKSLKR